MSDRDDPAPTRQGQDPGPGPGGLYDVSRLAQRLGVSTVTLRGARNRGVDWLPAPLGKLNGAPVWAAQDLEDIESRRRPVGRPRRASTNSAETARDREA